jgi:hypothetical protein
MGFFPLSFCQSAFEDPPLRALNGNITFETLNITRKRIYVRPHFAGIFFFGIFAILGIAAAVFAITGMITGDNQAAILLLPGIIFPIIGGSFIGFLCTREYPEIDLEKGYFYPEGKKKNNEYSPRVESDNIMALQLLACGKGYEIDLICRDSRRFNLQICSNWQTLTANAAHLSKILQVPVVDFRRQQITDISDRPM